MKNLQKLMQERIDKNKVVDAALVLMITFMVVLFKLNRDNLI